MFEDMFEPVDFHCAAEVRNLSFTQAHSFFFPQLGMSIDLYICSSD